jgi:hypothetical protein
MTSLAETFTVGQLLVNWRISLRDFLRMRAEIDISGGLVKRHDCPLGCDRLFFTR